MIAANKPPGPAVTPYPSIHQNRERAALPAKAEVARPDPQLMSGIIWDIMGKLGRQRIANDFRMDMRVQDEAPPALIRDQNRLGLMKS